MECGAGKQAVFVSRGYRAKQSVHSKPLSANTPAPVSLQSLCTAASNPEQPKSTMSSQARFDFPRDRRLSSKADFQRVFGGAKRVSDRFFTLLVKRNTGDVADTECSARLGLAVAKRRVATAVGRNRIKRQARELFRSNHAMLPGVDIVVLVNRANAKTDKQTIRRSLSGLFAQIQALDMAKLP